MSKNPTPVQERIISLDIIRGLALLGILISNMASFKSPTFQDQSFFMQPYTLPQGTWDKMADFFISLFIYGKFYPMFSLLFGLGFFLFYERLSRQGWDGKRLFRRRMLFLFILGLIHLIFIWSGDILHTYAIAGLFLLLFIHSSPMKQLTWGIALILLSTLVIGLLTVFSASMIYNDPESLQMNQSLVETALYTMAEGSYMEILTFRFYTEVLIIIFNLIFAVPNVLGIFLIGLYFGKKGMFHDVHKHEQTWRKIRMYTAWGGGLLAFLFVSLRYNALPIPFWLSFSLAETINITGGPVLMLCYVSSIVLAMQNIKRREKAMPLAFIGRMALTNYIFQSIVCVFLFYGFGLGLFGSVGVGLGALIALSLFALQVLLSQLWLKKYTQGPLEMLWRKWTYAGK